MRERSVEGWKLKACMRECLYPQTFLRVRLSLCNRIEVGKNRQEGRESEKEGGQLRGLGGKMWSSIAGSGSREKIIGR